MRRVQRTLLLGWLAATYLCACSEPVRRFALKEPLWQDPDRNHLESRPEERFLGTWADAADQTLLRPLVELFALRLESEAVNVNSLDEVPNSSWFTNRIGLFAMSTEQVMLGSCSAWLDPTRGPWMITRAKTQGQNPGFFVKMPDGGTYLLKFDGSFRPTRATCADVIGSKFYHAVGYNTPCNQIVYFQKDILKIAPRAMTIGDDGKKRPLQERDIELVLSKAYRRKNGQIRAVASRFLDGEPLGPFGYAGLRKDDPNDVVAHEDRRELRANRLLAAWLNHFDSRGANSLDMLVEEKRRRYVKHYMIDFGDCFGGSGEDLRLNRLVGHSHYFDLEHISMDFLSLGLIPRPWERELIEDDAEIFGFYKWENFVPSAWKGIYPNPAFDRMSYRDALWMVRIIVRFTDDQIRAAVKTGRLENPRHEKHLVEALIRRRDRIAHEYLRKYVPLDAFRLVRRVPAQLEQSLCFEDLAVKYAEVDPEHVVYKVRFMAGETLEKELGWLQFQPDLNHPHRSCILLPVGDKRPDDLVTKGASVDHPSRYGAVKIDVYQRPSYPPTSILLHMYDRGVREGFMLVGIERPPNLVESFRR